MYLSGPVMGTKEVMFVTFTKYLAHTRCLRIQMVCLSGLLPETLGLRSIGSVS